MLWSNILNKFFNNLFRPKLLMQNHLWLIKGIHITIFAVAKVFPFYWNNLWWLVLWNGLWASWSIVDLDDVIVLHYKVFILYIVIFWQVDYDRPYWEGLSIGFKKHALFRVPITKLWNVTYDCNSVLWLSNFTFAFKLYFGHGKLRLSESLIWLSHHICLLSIISWSIWRFTKANSLLSLRYTSVYIRHIQIGWDGLIGLSWRLGWLIEHICLS